LKVLSLIDVLSAAEWTILIKKIVFQNVILNISKYINKKIKLMNIYKIEIGSCQFPKSERKICALVTHNEASSDCEYDGNFMIINELI